MEEKSIILLPATTEAAVSEKLSGMNNNDTGLIVAGLQGLEYAIMQVYSPFNDNWFDCPDLKITSDSNPCLEGFATVLTYRIRKTATINPVCVEMIQKINTQISYFGST